MENNFNDVNFDVENFNPDELQTSETINAVFVIDVSPSICSYEKDLNAALRDFTETMQKSHVAPNLLVSIIEFNEDVKVKSGFQFIHDVNLDTFRGHGVATSLYDAVHVGMKNAIEYKKKQQAAGITCKTIVFIITDGEDNNSSYSSADSVKKMHEDILKSEKDAFSFTSILFGVGNESNFEAAATHMGIPSERVARVGKTGAEIRKMINFISSSISSVSSGQNISSASF